jgi:hypothetical protein
MKVKLLEVRDEGTFIPMLCVDMNPRVSLTTSPFEAARIAEAYAAQRYLLRRCGYPCDGRPNIAITPLRADGDKCSNDPHYWGDRTYAVAHGYITENWDKLKDGDVVDVSFILGETKEPKVSERVGAPL